MTPRVPKGWPHKFKFTSDSGFCYRVLRRHRRHGVTNRQYEPQVRKMAGRYGKAPLGHTITRRRQELAETPGYEVTVERVEKSIFRYTPVGDIYFE